MADHEISYEFNTTGFYNILSNQLVQNNHILDKISKKATNRLNIKRAEYNELLAPSKTKKNKQNEDSSTNPNPALPVSHIITSDRQLIKANVDATSDEQTGKLLNTEQKEEIMETKGKKKNEVRKGTDG